MKNVLLKDSVKEIKNTFKRFLSILLVVLLGVGFFAGIKATSPDMKKTIDKYFDEQNVMDIQVISTLGLTEDDLKTLQNIDGVEKVSASYYQDAIVQVQDSEYVMRMESIADDMNMLVLVEGSLPQETDECVVEEGFLKSSGYKIGDNINLKLDKIKDDDGNEKDAIKQTNLKIVGTVKSPLYISRERGSSKLGSGKINYYMYVNKALINSEYYVAAYIQVNGAKELKCYNDDYDSIIDNVKDRIESIEEERKQARYNEIYNNANKKIQNAEKTLKNEKNKAEKEINDAKNKISSAKTEIRNSKAELEKNKRSANTEFTNAQNKINEAQKQLTSQLNKFNNSKKDAEKQIAENKQKLEILKNMESKDETVTATIKALENGIEKAETELKENETKLNEAQKEINKNQETLNKQKKSTNEKFTLAEDRIKNAENEVSNNEAKLAKAEKEAKEKIQDAEEKLEDAKLKLKDIKKPEWHILDRNQNNGYVSYMQDTDRIANIATVFPVVFFLVAALISLTSMSRMVEEQRVQIGTLKALGYTKIKIASKYIIYALLATVIGSVIGLAMGFNVLPKIITDMYAMMYILPEVKLEFNLKYTVISIVLAMLCTVGATIYSCAKELKSTPANLMRPKAPKPGKRVFLENINWIWSKLKFTQKVTARNIFRYKKRFLMTVIGVMGSTALILAGFGIRDSISKMIPAQYGKIFKYNIQISLKDNISKKQIQEETEKIKQMNEIENIIKVNIQSVEITSIENTQNIQLIVPENTEELDKFISLQSRVKKDEKYKLGNTGVIITEKLSKVLNLKEGDTIKIKNSDNIEVETKISYITENYLMHYIYMSPELYNKLYSEDFSANTVFANTKEGTDEAQLGSNILESKNVTGVLFTSSTENIFAEVMDNMNFVVWILIISAGLLAFVVLYNLANTNISERIRELATIKVLGFYDREVYEYISKESNILTAIGIVLGLFAGYFLAMFIIKTCELDILMFNKEINIISFVYSAVITILFTIIVNVATYFSLKKINMIESLKSIE